MDATTTAVQATEAAHSSGITVVLHPEILTTVWGIPITNSLLMSWVVMLLLFTLALTVRAKLSLMPGKLQTFIELMFGFIENFIHETLENKIWARRLFPLLLTIVLFLVTANLIEFTPGVGSIVVHTAGGEDAPLLRSMNTDLNMTLAMTFIVMFVIELSGIVALGFWRYAGKFITFRGHGIGNRVMNFVVGIIELISELSRFVSFSFRLFGNIFAGEVLIAVVSFFVPYLLPSPVMAFEMFVGIVQGSVFALLTLFFVKMAIAEPHGDEH